MAHSRISISRKKIAGIIALIALLIIAILAALHLGNHNIPSKQLFSVISNHITGSSFPTDGKINTLVWNIRAPRIITAVLVGAALSVSGLIFQNVFRNPLVDPYVLGVASGSACGAGFAIVFGFLSVELSSILFGVLATVIICVIARNKSSNATLRLILAGLVISGVFSSILNLIKVIASDSKLREIIFWLMGGIYASNWSAVIKVAIVLFPIMAIFMLCSWKLNVLSLHEHEAQTLGVNVSFYRLLFILCATLLTAVCVSQVGIIAWIGLMIPHMVRLIFGADNRYALIATVFFGAIFLLISDTIARCVIMGEVPISVVTSLLGAPYLIYLICNRTSHAK